MEIRRLQQDDSIEDLTALLHKAYKRLRDLGFHYLATWQTPKTTKHRAEGGECYVAIDNGKLVGTITFYPAENTSDCEWYDRPGIASFGQFAVDPDLQNQGIGSTLIQKAEQRAQETGAEEIALDTAEGATHLIDLYAKRGYRLVGHADWKGANYRSVVMSKPLQR